MAGWSGCYINSCFLPTYNSHAQNRPTMTSASEELVSTLNEILRFNQNRATLQTTKKNQNAMPKTRTRGRRGKSRRLTDFASDVEMLEVDLPRSERLKTKGKTSPGLQTKHEDDRRNRVGKRANPAQPPPSSLRGSQTARGSSATTAGRKNLRSHTAAAAAAIPPLNPFAPRDRGRNRQLSVLSTLSAAAAGGPWCDKCNRLNRQLHGYLLEVLRAGEQAVDDWAYAVGASPDHMECEPAPERIIPEGYRRCSQQCQSCVARRSVRTPPASSGWSPSTTTTSTPAAAAAGTGGGGYQYQPGLTSAAQVENGGAGPYAHQAGAGPGSVFNGAAPDMTPSPPGGLAQVNHQLVAVPEGQPLLLHARWAGLPAPQLHPPQQPWEDGPQRGAFGANIINNNDDNNNNKNVQAGRWNNPGAEVLPTGPSGHALQPSASEYEQNFTLPITPPRESDNNRTRPRRVTPTPVHPAAYGGGPEAHVPQWGVPPQ